MVGTMKSTESAFWMIQTSIDTPIQMLTIFGRNDNGQRINLAEL
jgi:hypothetical protein